jgi:hypothetical protein
VDYRLKENRREAFIKWYAWSLEYKDCDPAVWMTNYLNDRFEHNSEQRIWLSWLYGNTYYLPTAWILINEYPDFELATYDRMNAWNTENYKRLRYQTDTKWSKGHLPDMFKSYHEFVGSGLQREAFELHMGDNEFQNFDNLYAQVKDKFYKFGRYSAWFFLQHLNHTADIPNVPSTLLLNDYSGSRSHRNGLLMALGMDDKYDEKLSIEEYQNLEAAGREIMEEVKIRFPHLTSDVNPFTMETCLCSFKKVFREHHGRYLGYYNDRVAEEIRKVEADEWNGIEWRVLWEAREETLDKRIYESKFINKGKFSDLVKTGNIDRLDWMFSEDNKVVSGLEEFM